MSASGNKDLQYAYRSIHKFFEFFELPLALSYVQTSLKAAAGIKVWDKNEPGELLFFMNRLQALVKACRKITAQKAFDKKAVLEIAEGQTIPDITLHKQFVPKGCSHHAWLFVPRHLGMNRYFDPYKVFKKATAVYTKAEWKEILQDLPEYALSKTSVEAKYDAFELLKIQQLLLQLVEACHLVAVRAGSKL